MIEPDRELRWLRRLRDLTHELARESDPRKLVPRILDAAIELAQAERGFLVRVERRGRSQPAPAPASGRVKMKVEVARGFDQETLAGAQGKVSRTVVERVLERGRGLVTTSEEDQDVREVSSVQARRVLSILCVPLQLRGETTGVLYLDHRFDPDVFGEADLPIVLAFADQAALALETAELAQARPPAPGGAAHAPPAVDPEDPGEAKTASGPAATPTRLGRLVTRSPLLRAAFEEVERAARSSSHVLVTGESGTGKELVARELHARGAPSGAGPRPFVAVGCAGQTEAAIELELFGRRGPPGDRRGQLALAGAGTLFLDEVGELPVAVQGKLLRVLQEGRFRPLGAVPGAEHDVALACRVVAASRHDLRALVAEGKLREDLFYRLDVMRIALPPLRARPEDVPLLLAQVLEAEAKGPVEVTEKALELLSGYSWPGNVRELENEARRLAALGEAKVTARHLSPEVAAGRGLARAAGAWSGKTLGEVEKEMVVAALRESGGNKARAARQLGIPKTTLYHLIERYELT